MASEVFKGITIVGTSNQSFSHAIEVAMNRVKQTVRELRWFKVVDQTGGMRDGEIEYQVTIEVFFKIQADDLAQS